MKRSVGIEIREKEIRVVVVEKEKAFRIAHSLFLDNLHDKKKELKDFFIKHRLNPYQVAISVSSFGTLIRKFSAHTPKEI